MSAGGNSRPSPSSSARDAVCSRPLNVASDAVVSGRRSWGRITDEVTVTEVGPPSRREKKVGHLRRIFHRAISLLVKFRVEASVSYPGNAPCSTVWIFEDLVGRRASQSLVQSACWITSTLRVRPNHRTNIAKAHVLVLPAFVYIAHRTRLKLCLGRHDAGVARVSIIDHT